MIVVTTPTGNIGHHVLANLVETKKPVRVIARNPDKIDPQIRDRIEIVQGSHSEESVVDKAFEGASALFWLAPGEPYKTPEAAYVDFARPAADAIKRHGVSRIVSITALGRGTRWENHAGLVTASLRMDDLLMSTGAHFRGLAMPSFMDNVLHTFEVLRDHGKLVGPHVADVKAPKTAGRDVGATAARLLADETWSGQSELKLIGPEELSSIDMAAIISEVLGRHIPFEEVSYADFRQQAIERGAVVEFADAFAEMFQAKDEGLDEGPYSGDVEAAPTTFRQWCEGVLKPMLELQPTAGA